MQQGISLREVGICAAGALALLAAPFPADASAARRPADQLSPRLAQLAKPSLRSAPPARQARALDLPAEGPASLVRDGNRVLVEVRFQRGAAVGADDLRAAGARIVNVSRRYQTVTVAAKPAQLPPLAAAPRVASATEVLAPLVQGAGESPLVAAAATPCFGAATSEGDEQLRAAQARADFGVDGSEVSVGILSDSFDQDAFAPTRQTEDVASGDLPGPVNPCGRTAPVSVLEDFGGAGVGDEGRAMAQIVHDLAPGAEISFASAFTGLFAFAENIEDLAAAGADAIVDDVVYFNEPFFQEGPVGVAVDNVVAGGAAYFSSAGNNNLIREGRDIASWEAPQYRDAGSCPPGLVALSKEYEEFEEELEEEEPGLELPGIGLNASHCLDFDPSGGVDTTFEVTVAKGATLIADLQWAEPWEGVADDVDVFLLNPEGDVLAGSIEDNVVESKQPFELIGWENETGAAADVELVVNRYSGPNLPRIKFALLQNGGGVTATEYESGTGGDVVGPTIFGHNGAGAAMSVGAIRYTTNEAPEKFSSRGPVTHYFGPADGTVTPAPPLGEPEELAKPDLVATDGGATTFFGACSGGAWRFFGTSAAAPHAAAIAALQWDAQEAATAAEVREAQRQGAVEVGAFPVDAVGFGRIDAVGAIEELGVAPAPSGPPEPAPAPLSCVPGEPEPEPEPAPPPSADTPQTSQQAPSESRADRSPPRTFLRRRPPHRRLTRRRAARVVFVFGSNERRVTFLCKVDRGRVRRCPRRFVRRYRRGRHVLRVKARDRAGNVDRTPVVYRFRVVWAGRRR